MELTEFDEQKLLIKWFDLQYKEKIVLFSIPNGIYTKNLIIAKKAKATGMRAGVPDLFLAVPNKDHAGLFIEMKKEKGGRVSEAQECMITNLRNAGYQVEVCKGFDQAKYIIEKYLGKSKTV